MSNIFISYAHEDRQIAERLAQALEDQHWNIFWDPKISAGKEWRVVISEQLAAAQCVVVLWSKASSASNFVLDEAEIGRERKILVPLFIEQNIRPPLGFGGVQAADFSKWDGSSTDGVFQRLVVDITALLPPAAAGQAQQEADSIRIQEILYRRQQFRKRYTLAGLTVGGALGAGLGIFFLRAILGFTVMDFDGFALSVARAFGTDAAILGAAFSFGIALADQIWKAGNERSAKSLAWIRILFRSRAIVAMILGTIFFAASHTIIATLNGMPAFSGEAVKSISAAGGAGLALSISLYDQPYAGWRLPLVSWIWRIGIVALTFLIVQLPFSLKRTAGTGLSLIGGADFYRDRFVFWRLVPLNLRSPSYLAMIDSALVGAVLCVGLTFGIVKAAALLSRSLKQIDVAETKTEVTE